MAARQQDTQRDALAGKLGRSEGGVQDAFRRLDAMMEQVAGPIDRHAIRRGGEWVGRSYKLDGKLLLRVDPKVASLRVQVGKAAYGAAPTGLRGTYKQEDWLIVRPEDAEQGLAYIKALLPTRAGRGR